MSDDKRFIGERTLHDELERREKARRIPTEMLAFGLGLALTIGGWVWYASGLMTREATNNAIKERCVNKEAFAMLRGEVDSNRKHLGRIERKIDANSKKLDRLIWARAHGRKKE